MKPAAPVPDALVDLLLGVAYVMAGLAVLLLLALVMAGGYIWWSLRGRRRELDVDAAAERPGVRYSLTVPPTDWLMRRLVGHRLLGPVVELEEVDGGRDTISGSEPVQDEDLPFELAVQAAALRLATKYDRLVEGLEMQANADAATAAATARRRTEMESYLETLEMDRSRLRPSDSEEE